MPDTSRRLAPGITSDPTVSFGRACVTGTGIPAVVLAERHRAGDSVDALAADYGLTTSQVEQAVAYIGARRQCGELSYELGMMAKRSITGERHHGRSPRR